MKYLHDAGFNVAIYYYAWFVHKELEHLVNPKYPLVHIEELTHDDLLIVAEEFAWICHDELIPRKIPYVILNQGISGSLRSGISFQDHKKIYEYAKFILVNSNHSERGVMEIFDIPQEKIKKFRIGIDRNEYFPGYKKNMISYLTFKNGEFASFIGQYLDQYSDKLIIEKMQQLPKQQVIEIMKHSKLFLSFGGPEGFGLPPLEAAFCGCKVLGFNGGGGEEYWKSPVFTSIPFHDHITFIKELKKSLQNLDYWDAYSLEYIDYLRDFYSITRARNSIVKIFEEIK